MRASLSPSVPQSLSPFSSVKRVPRPIVLHDRNARDRRTRRRGVFWGWSGREEGVGGGFFLRPAIEGLFGAAAAAHPSEHQNADAGDPHDGAAGQRGPDREALREAFAPL